MIFVLVFPELQQLFCHKVYEQCTLHIAYLWNFNLHRSTHGALLPLSYTIWKTFIYDLQKKPSLLGYLHIHHWFSLRYNLMLSEFILIWIILISSKIDCMCKHIFDWITGIWFQTCMVENNFRIEWPSVQGFLICRM
jgi:hypothetical protein